MSNEVPEKDGRERLKWISNEDSGGVMSIKWCQVWFVTDCLLPGND